MYIIGKTGMGKSTLLENLAIQDIQNGNGLAFLDPHGGTAEKLLEYVPEHRIKDVLYFAPFDLEHPISFNVIEDIGADKRHLVVNGLMSTFEKIWSDAWSARMSYILQYTILALLEYPGATLLGINKMLSDKEYRKKVVDNLKDASTKSFWIDEFGKYTEKFAAEATPAIQNKVGQFASNPLIRNIIGQSTSSFDIRKIMDEKKILIVNLSKGRVGEGNANLLGSMLITKIYLAAMSRADMGESEISKLPNFYLYVDEFQSFANKSFANILSEARKYKLNLTIAHQYIEQMEEEVRDAVFGNVGTMITFRVGAFDAEVLEKEFAPVFTAEDLVNLGFTQIYLKLMIDGVSSAPFSATTMGPINRPETSSKDKVIESSRNLYSKNRSIVEEEITAFYSEKKVIVDTKKDKVNSSFPINNVDNRVSNNNQVNNTFQNQPQKFFNPTIPVEREIDLTKEDFKDKVVEDKNRQAFLKAKEELLELENKKVILVNPVAEKINKPSDKIIPEKQEKLAPQVNKFPDSNKTISVQESKVIHEKVKIPTTENLNSLKSALSVVLEKNKNEIKSRELNVGEVNKNIAENKEVVKTDEVVKKVDQVKENNSVKKDEKIQVPTASSNHKQEETVFVKEVPEDVLKKLLSMD
jgi:energy-coupling factor transporter ATP-binding protein EcfA2